MNLGQIALHRYEYRSRWSNLRLIGKSPFAKISVLMPIFGYMILLNGKILDYVDIDPRFRLISSESPWRIVMLYYGSFLAGIATAIFTWKCPAIVSRYSSTVEFVNSETMFYSEPKHYEYLVHRLREFNNRIQKWKRDGFELSHLRTEMAIGAPFASQNLGRYLALFWHCRDYEATFWRVMTRLLFDASIVVLTIPAAVSLFGVTKYVFGLNLLP